MRPLASVALLVTFKNGQRTPRNTSGLVAVLNLPKEEPQYLEYKCGWTPLSHWNKGHDGEAKVSFTVYPNLNTCSCPAKPPYSVCNRS